MRGKRAGRFAFEFAIELLELTAVCPNGAAHGNLLLDVARFSMPNPGSLYGGRVEPLVCPVSEGQKRMSSLPFPGVLQFHCERV